MQEAIGKLEGAALGDMLDFLSKELVRFQVSGLLVICMFLACMLFKYLYLYG